MPRTLLVAVALAAALAGCASSPAPATTPTSTPTPAATPSGGNPPGQPGASTVDLKGIAFVPATLNVTRGATVVWTNRDATQHTVTSAGEPKFESSGTLDPGATFSAHFTTAGTFEYVCAYHAEMAGRIVVS